MKNVCTQDANICIVQIFLSEGGGDRKKSDAENTKFSPIFEFCVHAVSTHSDRTCFLFFTFIVLLLNSVQKRSAAQLSQKRELHFKLVCRGGPVHQSGTLILDRGLMSQIFKLFEKSLLNK